MSVISSRLGWAGDIFLLRAFRPLLTDEGTRRFHGSLVWAGVLGMIEGVGLFAVIPACTAFVEGRPSLGLPWWGWIWVLAVLAVAGGAVSYVQSSAGYLCAMDVLSHLSTRIGDHVARLPLGWFRSDFPARLSRLLTRGLMSLGESLGHFTAPLVRGMTTTLVMMILAWAWSWQLGLALLLAIPIIYLLTIASRALKLRGEALTYPAGQEVAARIVEFCESQPALRAAGRASGYQPLHDAQAASGRAARKDLWLAVLANFLSGLAAQGIAVTLVMLAANLGGSGRLSPVVAVAFVGISLRYTKVLEDVCAATLAIETVREPIAEVNEILSATVLPEPDNSVELSAPGEVSFEGVTFGYDQARPVVHDISFTAPAGGLTAIVGPTGAGKSTLFRLIARFWDVDSGTVRVGGADVRSQTTEQLMSQLAMVFQDVYLFDDSLIANIRVGRPDASDEEVFRAADLSGVTSIANRLGWHTPVGEGGRLLSGGERQRVSVARALLKQAPIVLFDEATSALDAENEANILAAMDELREQSTFIVIAHKLDTIKSADQIVVLDEHGQVSQLGTHSELSDVPGIYRHFWQQRKAARGWKINSGRD